MNTNLVFADLSGAFRHANTVSAGVRFHYLFQGAGFPVILLSGFPQSSYAWRKVIPELAGNYRVVAPDLPGQGDSDLPIDGYDTGTVAKRLDLFLSELGLERFHLVGHDVGAWVAFSYAATFRSKIETLTVIDAGIPGISLRPEIRLQEARNRWHFLFQQVPELAESLIAGREEAYITWFLPKQSGAAGCLPRRGYQGIHSSLFCSWRYGGQLQILSSRSRIDGTESSPGREQAFVPGSGNRR